MHFRMTTGGRVALAALAFGSLFTFSGCDAPTGEEGPEAKAGEATVDPVIPPKVNEGDAPTGDKPEADDSSAESDAPTSAPSALGSAEQVQVVEAVATILGDAPESIDLDRPILNAGREIEEFDLLEIMIELEDRFDVEIDEGSIERASGGRFDQIQKTLTPRQLFGIVAEATRVKE